jgi:LmbE family N-acetylglucosaminyl deacetylase
MTAHTNPALDILAIAAHRDDVEQTCGGTLLKMAQRGRRTGILDLTQGELGTRGTAEDRAAEAAEAARILKVAWRRALDIPDGRVENTWENRLKVAYVLREMRPRVVILPYWYVRPHPN